MGDEAVILSVVIDGQYYGHDTDKFKICMHGLTNLSVCVR